MKQSVKPTLYHIVILWRRSKGVYKSLFEPIDAQSDEEARKLACKRRDELEKLFASEVRVQGEMKAFGGLFRTGKYEVFLGADL